MGLRALPRGRSLCSARSYRHRESILGCTLDMPCGAGHLPDHINPETPVGAVFPLCAPTSLSSLPQCSRRTRRLDPDVPDWRREMGALPFEGARRTRATLSSGSALIRAPLRCHSSTTAAWGCVLPPCRLERAAAAPLFPLCLPSPLASLSALEGRPRVASLSTLAASKCAWLVICVS